MRPFCRLTCTVVWLSCLLVLLPTASFSLEEDPCVVPDDGTGTADIPPQSCQYWGDDEVFMIIDGLPPGITIELEPIFHDFVCELGVCGVPGGSLGGEIESFDGTMLWQMRGTGALADFRRIVRLPVVAQTHSGPRTPGDPVQAFPQDFFSLQGALPPGDPDFDLLQLTAGTNFGLPSPGSATLTDLGDGTFQVDSFFDLTYQITFTGSPGSPDIAGLSGTTTGTVRIQTYAGVDLTTCCDNGVGTVTLPPLDSELRSLHEDYRIIDGLPPGTTMELDPVHGSFVCVNPGCELAGGPLGGHQQIYTGTLDLVVNGTGSLTGFNRTLLLPISVTTLSGPRTPGDTVQIFDRDTATLTGILPPGDPDFDQLHITAGTANGLPSPGETTLTDLGDETFQVDSFFDVTYQVDFVGAPGSALDGLAGTTQGSLRLTSVNAPGGPTCIFFDGFEGGDASRWSDTQP